MGKWYAREGNTVLVKFYIQPGAKRTEIAGIHGDELKIRLAASPIDGRANDALLKYVAQLFNVPVRQVTLKRGGKSRHKQIVITGSKVEPLCITKPIDS